MESWMCKRRTFTTNNSRKKVHRLSRASLVESAPPCSLTSSALGITMRLSDFIIQHIESILVEWEAFAKTIEPPALTMDSKELRDHAVNMLHDIALDISNPQTARAQRQKSHGAGRLIADESSAEVHAAARLFSGFTIEQLVSEYRALRASVLKLWAR